MLIVLAGSCAGNAHNLPAAQLVHTVLHHNTIQWKPMYVCRSRNRASRICHPGFRYLLISGGHFRLVGY